MAQSTSIQRVQRLIDSVPLTNLMFTLLSTSYKKVPSLHDSRVDLKPLCSFSSVMFPFRFLIKVKKRLSGACNKEARRPYPLVIITFIVR